MMITVLEYGGVCETFESVIVCVTTCGSMVQAITKMATRVEKVTALVARFVAHDGKKKVNEAAQQQALAAPLSLPPSPDQ